MEDTMKPIIRILKGRRDAQGDDDAFVGDEIQTAPERDMRRIMRVVLIALWSVNIALDVLRLIKAIRSKPEEDE
jgi:hypothetical protein